MKFALNIASNAIPNYSHSYIYIWKILKFNFQSNSYFLIMKLLLLTSFPSPTNLTGNKILYLSMIFQLWYGLLSKNRKKMYSLLKVAFFLNQIILRILCAEDIRSVLVQFSKGKKKMWQLAPKRFFCHCWEHLEKGTDSSKFLK